MKIANTAATDAVVAPNTRRNSRIQATWKISAAEPLANASNVTSQSAAIGWSDRFVAARFFARLASVELLREP
jgi:hypothetical protein